ncbi:MAG TPA: hypothetical protein ENJ95_18190 [Bacteroidetes bacterium]|nr:hypothetical protein [Bacteroidota bacterium]
MVFPVLWFLIVRQYGVVFENNGSGGNVFERLFIYDIWERFTQNEIGWKKAFDLNFFFYSVDKMFNVWSIIFFCFLTFGLFYFIIDRKQVVFIIKNSKHRLLLLSLCLYFPLAVFLTIASKSNSWYIAPVIPFVGVVVFYAVDKLWRFQKVVGFIFVGLLVSTMAIRFVELYSPKNRPKIIENNCSLLSSADKVYIVGNLEQDILLYNYFCNQNLKFGREQEKGIRGENIIFIKNEELKTETFEHFKVVDKSQKYSVLKRVSIKTENR